MAISSTMTGPPGHAKALVARFLDRLQVVLPQGRPLPDDVWRHRHTGILVLLWLHVVGIIAFGLLTGNSLAHTLAETAALAGLTALAGWPRFSRRLRASLASVGLITASALVVHLSGGYIEFHFHFFVMVVVIALYQDWQPFLLTLGYVVLHHGLIGVLVPTAVYNHPDAWANPWKWALIHAVFVLGISAASLVNWRLNEAARARTELVLASVGDGIIGVDRQGVITFANAAATRLLGWPPAADLGGRRLHDVLGHSPADATLREERVQHETDQLFRRRDGATFPVEYVTTPLREGGQFTGAVLAFRDITARKQAEEALHRANAELEDRVAERTAALQQANGQLQHELAERQRAQAENQRLAAIVASSQDAIISTALDNSIVSWNTGAEHLYGYTAAEAIGRPIAILYPPHLRDDMTQVLTEVIAGENVDHYETVRLRKDGAPVDVSLTISPIRNEYGQVIGTSAIAHDISARKQTQVELRQAKEAAEAANQAKSDFLATMSHEIRTPMNGVIGMAELLLATELTPEQRQYAEIINTSGETLLSIINDILDFSKIEAGKMRLETFDFDLRTAVEDVAGLFAERAHVKGLELLAFVEPRVPSALRGDPFRLRQVLTNLLGNAIKFTERGEVSVRVSVAEETAEAVTVRFMVTDTGIGLTSAERSRLFQSFSQADASTTRRYGGTGLGLAISKQLVELMAGTIGVESAPGQGSTFWFTARLSKQEPGFGTTGTLRRTDLHGVRVLVVDDNVTNRTILYQQLTSWGVHNASAEDGPAALTMLRAAAARGEPYDLAILDMQMPGMDGLMLARVIKTEAAIAAVRLVMLTSISRHSLADEARQAGIAACLTKPVRQSQLYECLTTVLGTPAAAATAVPQAVVPTPRQPGLVPAYAPNSTDAPTILLAEDNVINQQVATRMLERLGYRVDLAANGPEAVAAFAHGAYAAVLMDCQMPEMDGYAATAMIRAHEGEARHTPIIAMTANALPGDRERCLAAGMDDYLAKPVKSETLAAVLERWVQRTHATPAGAPSPDPDAALDQAIDPLALANLRDLQDEGDPDIVGEVIEQFLSDAPRRLASLSQAVRQQDAHALEREAHTLKGSCLALGARPMADIAEELQALGRAQSLAPAAEVLARLEREFTRVHAALSAELVEV